MSTSNVLSAVCLRLGITQIRDLCHSVAFNAASIFKEETVVYSLLSYS